jgi:hypothetical protein
MLCMTALTLLHAFFSLGLNMWGVVPLSFSWWFPLLFSCETIVFGHKAM